MNREVCEHYHELHDCKQCDAKSKIKDLIHLEGKQMKYKKITLNKNRNGKLYFTEEELPEHRENNGEYIFINCAFIYKASSSIEWKNKMIQQFEAEVRKEIDKFSTMLHDLEILKEGLS